MGVLPLQFIDGINRNNLNLKGSELISIINIEKGLNPSDKIEVEIKYQSGELKKGMKLKMMGTNASYVVEKCGFFTPKIN